MQSCIMQQKDRPVDPVEKGAGKRFDCIMDSTSGRPGPVLAFVAHHRWLRENRQNQAWTGFGSGMHSRCCPLAPCGICNSNHYHFHRTMCNLRRSVVNCCARATCNICWPSAIGRKLSPVKRITSTRCAHIVWSRARWSNGATTGHVASSSVRATTRHMPDSSHKSDGSTMFITFGVRIFINLLRNSIWLISTSDVRLLFLSGYKSLQDRKESREASWRSPGWDECVAYTVPLIKDMHCRILVPTDFSATQWGDNNNQQQTTTTDCIYVNIIPNDDHFWGEFFIFCIARKWNSHKIQHTKTEVIIIFLSFLLMNIETNRFKSSTIFYVRGFNVILCFVLFYFAVSEWTQLLFK